MNDNIKDVIAALMIDAKDKDLEKIAIAVIKKYASLQDSWTHSGQYDTFGDRLRAYFGVEK